MTCRHAKPIYSTEIYRPRTVEYVQCERMMGDAQINMGGHIPRCECPYNRADKKDWMCGGYAVEEPVVEKVTAPTFDDAVVQTGYGKKKRGH